MEKRLLDILCCPATRVAVRAATRHELDAVNRAIGTGSVRNTGGVVVGATLTAALVTADRKRLYRIEDDIPVLLGDEAIDADQIAGFPGRESNPHEL